MDSPLALHLACLLFPLCAKPLPFVGLADRAIPLLSIDQVKGMPIFAVSFLGINRRQRIALPQRILSWGRQPQVLVINTISVTASVIDYHPVRDVSIVVPVHYSMSTPTTFSEVKDAIPVFVQGSLRPKNALSYLFCFAQKAIEFLWGHSHKWYQVSTWFILAKTEV